MRAAGLIAVTLGLAACQSVPEVVPFRGIAPARILVVPTLRGGERESLATLDSAFADAIANRGYDVVVGDAAASKLEELGWDRRVGGIHAVPLAQLAERHAIDAIWSTVVNTWRLADGPGRPLHYDLRVSVVATRTEDVVWIQDLTGSERTLWRQKGVDAIEARNPFEADDPVPWRTELRVLTTTDVAGLVARHFGARLPAR